MTTLISVPLLTTSYYSQKPTVTSMTRKRLVFCMSLDQTNASDHGDKQRGSPATFDRRNVLLGLAGVNGASQLVRNDQALGAPVQAPLECHDATVEGIGPVKCCRPDYKAEVVDFKFPSDSTPMRVRRPAHMQDPENLLKYKEAINIMRKLKDDDPWSLTQQAKIHCAYCNGAYDQLGYKTLLSVHSNWLFLPFHRLYMYFFERILGKLIGDETLSIPYWNYAAPKGYDQCQASSGTLVASLR
ncbi:hypothetical protein HHK36_032507 [Tetracentron sinense]|uniref:Tyrosinase copper-binding domain-containing protein n=1 Tax=Tetracentron sinense TaxID=13715 RepID=A0A835CZH3_TETSI|nr:hypothetical protein HHK36_032507 [Tetracentron sinense]